MIAFRVGSHRFNYRAAAVVFDDGYLLLHRLEGDEFWALPGGRVNPGERAQDAIRREFLEELDVSVECGELLCTGENFFEHEGEPHHEIGLYFAATLPASGGVVDKNLAHLGSERGRQLLFRWFLLHDLPHIDLRPSALKKALASGSLPAHFVQGDEAKAL